MIKMSVFAVLETNNHAEVWISIALIQKVKGENGCFSISRTACYNTLRAECLVSRLKQCTKSLTETHCDQ